ncbi:hypothetical protein M378DRAFT_171753 [Amanita muscaria Koide BX008]|uniref:Nephrocystin 3-like N-terminal domain-containing protein n=1 Tax=Amanita muscaria (strain Koide BX008) TaxID=946122 RepID=A0A0C2S421_AMAMK|nr:hypothetical protein M378DRAFT_171753 [Amanita muscaria Koide BX008]
MPSSAFGASSQQSSQINNQDNIVELDRLFAAHVSKDALRNYFHSPPEGHPNTRTTVRNEIGVWMDESESKKSPLLWLNGPAAVVNSVIAKTISGYQDQIIATFFFSTSSDRSAATLFTTLAWQLARRIPDTRKHIIASLKNSGSLRTSHVEKQFDSLIIQPLKKCSRTLKSRPVMVIGGADECTDQSMLLRFLRVLVQASEGGEMPVRFIVCSRPEPMIYAILGRVRDVNQTTNGQEQQSPILVSIALHIFSSIFLSLALLASLILNELFTLFLFALIESFKSFRRLRFHSQIQQIRGTLQEVWELYRPIRLSVDTGVVSSETSNEPTAIYLHSVVSTIQIGFSKECEEDIARYLTDKFNAIRQPGEGTGPWLQPCDISEFADASCGHFLYASTIVRLLDDPYTDSRDVLKMARCGSLPTPDLNELYKNILKRAQDTVKEGDADYRTEWGFVMDSLALLIFLAGNEHFFTVRKSLPFIETLLGLESGKLTLKLSKMHSVLRIVPGESIEVHHRSFLEFLQSKECSGEYYTAYSTAMQRTLNLIGRAMIKDGGHECIRDMINECRENFWRSRTSSRNLHFSIHALFSFFLILQMRNYLPDSVLVADKRMFFYMYYLFLVAEAFFISLTTFAYIFFFDRSIIVPFFHPFLNPFFNFVCAFSFPFAPSIFPMLHFALYILPVALLWYVR